MLVFWKKCSYILSNNVLSVTGVKITANWQSIPGRLTRISRGKAGVWGVNKHGHIFRLNSDGSIFSELVDLFGHSSNHSLFKSKSNRKQFE